MNLIVVMLDSFRQDHVGVYNRGCAPFSAVRACETPNIDRFAKDCIVFENAYPGGLPTIPVRSELMTGQETLPYRPWEPLSPRDITVAEILRREGYVCGLVSDTYHYRAPGMNFHRAFHAYRWIRGQEYDPYVSSPPHRQVEAYVNANYTEDWKVRISQFLANTDGFTGEQDWFPAKVVDEAVEWLKCNRVHRNVFLWVDCFDPHEPWDPPPAFDTYRPDGHKGPRLIMPMGGLAERWATVEEIEQIRGLYAGEASFVDHCLGRLFAALQDLGYYDDSLVFLLADHGHPLADHGKFLKGTDRMYSELLKLPFLVRLPGASHARRTPALVQFPDVLPTTLDVLGLGNNIQAMHGRSFASVLYKGVDEHRSAVISGYHEGVERCIRDARWSYIQRPQDQPDELYDLKEDPKERRNLIDERLDQSKRLAALFGSHFRRGESRGVKGVQGRYELAASSLATGE